MKKNKCLFVLFRVVVLSLMASNVFAVCSLTPENFDSYPCYSGDPAEWIFKTDNVIDIKMILEPQAYAALNDPWNRDADGKPAYVNVLSIVVMDKGVLKATLAGGQVKLKGSGSFQELSGKAAFKIKLGDRLNGLRKLTLNNMLWDDSKIHEALAYGLYRAVGVPASRVGYARVSISVNGDPDRQNMDYGLYANIETYDKTSLPKIFNGSVTKHLYEAASHGVDVAPGNEAAFEIDEGNTDKSDLTSLIAAAQVQGTAWRSEVEKVVDLQLMVKMWAVEHYIGNFDGYTSNLNNYYLHSSTVLSGSQLQNFTMLPSGLDESFTGFHGGVNEDVDLNRHPFDYGIGILFQRCMEDVVCYGMYANALKDVRTKAGVVNLTQQAQDIYSFLRDDYVLTDPRMLTTIGEADQDALNSIAFINSRSAKLDEWLAGDLDLDGVKNAEDAFPDDPAEWLDIDADDIGNAADADDDGDGLFDGVDNCPVNSNYFQENIDGDSQGDLCDLTPNGDADGDGVDQLVDNCPVASNANQLDTDSDGAGDECDVDDDGDGVADVADNCALSVAAGIDQTDTDSDGQGNVCDEDDDGDGSADGEDGFPLDPVENSDVDGDVIGNNGDVDDDGDGELDVFDNCPLSFGMGSSQLDTDGDAAGDLCDLNDDGDAYSDAQEVVLGSSTVNSLDPPLIALASGSLFAFDDVDYAAPGDLTARSFQWGAPNLTYAGIVGVSKLVKSVTIPQGVPGGCWLVGATVDCGNGTLNNVAKLESDGDYNCALLLSGAVACWYGGDLNTTPVSPVPTAQFTYAADISVGGGGSCALGPQSIYCWKNALPNAQWLPVIPYGFNHGIKNLAVNDIGFCLTIDSAVLCFDISGDHFAGALQDINNVSPLRLVAGDEHMCVLEGNYLEPASLRVLCWGAGYGTVENPQVLDVDAPVAVVAEQNRVCVVEQGSADASMAVRCWPDNDDGDGVLSPVDHFPSNIAASVDTDGDGYPDVWNSGCDAACQDASGLVLDAFPSDPTEWLDTDSDGVGNNVDANDDNDCYLDGADPAPMFAGTTKAGDHDCSFDVDVPPHANPNDGAAETTIAGASPLKVYAAALQADGKVVVAGSASNQFLVLRYTSDGSLDSSFDDDGILMPAVGYSSEATAVLVQPADGKIVVAGYSVAVSGAPSTFAIARYNGDGTPDQTFNGGSVRADGFFTGKSARVASMAFDAAGKIVVAGYTVASGNNFKDVAVMRYGADGSLDASFDGDGKRVIALSADSHDEVKSILVQPDGKIVMAGYTILSGRQRVALLRLDDAGVVNLSINTEVISGRDSWANGVLLQSDGKLVVGGTASATGTGPDFAMVRYNSDGTLDAGFGAAGKVVTAISAGGGNDQTYNLLQQADGKLVLSGYSVVNGSTNFTLARYLSTGVLDNDFATAGVKTALTGSESARAVLQQADGKLVTVGNKPFGQAAVIVQRFFAETDSDGDGYKNGVDAYPLDPVLH